MRRSLIVALAFAAVLPASAFAAPRPRHVWATINVCDTELSPDRMGVRGGMPGNGTRQRMYMRFTASWFNRDDGKWRAVEGSRSGWVYAGSARRRRVQAGYTFGFDAPAPGSPSFVVRGIVDYQWRERRRRKGSRRARWVVVERARRTTRHGYPDVDGADPPGTSLGVCEIR